MTEENLAEMIQYLRQEIIKAQEITCQEKNDSKNGVEYSNGYWAGKKVECYIILRKLVDFGAKFDIDKALITEANLLMPKVGLYSSHEINRSLYCYEESFKTKNYGQAVLNEMTLRQFVVQGRLELIKQKI